MEEKCNIYKSALLSNIPAADENNPRQLKVIIKDTLSERRSVEEKLEDRITNIIVYKKKENQMIKHSF